MNDWPARLQHARLHDQLIVVPCGRLVAYPGLDHGDPATLLCLQPAIVEPTLPHQFHPAHLAPHHAVGVVDHAHLVGLRITYAHPRLADGLLTPQRAKTARRGPRLRPCMFAHADESTGRPALPRPDSRRALGKHATTGSRAKLE